MTTVNAVPIAAWMLLTGWRLWVVPKRLRLPLLRGPEYFFNVRVAPDFYSGSGRPLLRRYQAALLAPYAVEWPLAAACVYTRHYAYLLWLIVASGVLSSVLQYVLVKRFDREARGMPGAAGPPEAAAVAVSLEQRTLAEYTSGRLEIALGGLTLVCAALLLWQYQHAERDLSLFFMPGLVLYAHLGVLLLKDTLVRTRMRVPAQAAEEYTVYFRALRAVRTKMCDWIRAILTAMLLTFSLLGPLQDRWGFSGRWMAMLPLIGMLFAYLAGMKRILTDALVAARRVRPLDMAKITARRADPGRFRLGGLLYFDADNPLLVVRGRMGPTLNLAHPRSYAFLAWIGCLAVIVAWRAQ